jgi:DNA-binding NarL/FixJ family response regulator
VAKETIPEATHLRVYVVEDSPIIVRLLRDLLAAEPSLRHIGQSKDAKTAIFDITTLRPDIVILDLSLVGSSGFDVLEALTAWPHVDRPLVAVLSNYVSDSYRQRALRLNADYFFDKSREIVRMLRTLSDLSLKNLAGFDRIQRRGQLQPASSP